MDSFRDIIDRWPSRSALGEEAGASASLVSKWWQRDSIPSEYWIGIVGAAERRGISGVNTESLARLAARKIEGATPVPEGAR
jgi:hypothetical protein